MRYEKIINSLIILAILAGSGTFYYQNYIKSKCDSPITYKIGTFDTRFGISKNEFLSNITTASNIWDKSINKKLFEYSNNGKLTINLVYDSRQKITEQNQILKADVDKLSTSASSIKEQYTALQNKYKQDDEIYKNLVKQFEENQKTYNDKVIYWNAHNGAPEDIYNALDTEHKQLEFDYATLEQKRTALNTLVENINTFIHTYNLLVDNANENINKINVHAGKEFEEGIYDPNTNTITIYEFSDNTKLIRVLAHELGHALLLPHNSNQLSIMYEINQGDTSILSEDDIQSLKEHCKIP